MAPKSVLVLGANGYIGVAVCRAFVSAGWQVYGLLRRAESVPTLLSQEVIPILGSPSNLDFLDSLVRHTVTFEAIVDCSNPTDYEKYFNESLALIRLLSGKSNANGVRPLVLWTSGCKDYGSTDLDGAVGLSPHIESSPLNTPSILIPRAQFSLKILEHTDLFDAAVLRPTNVFGYSSSMYGIIFDFAASAAADGAQSLTLVDVNPRTIIHAMHIDDCASAYVALAEHPDRGSVSGQCFNISGREYDTVEEVMNALTKEYNFPNPPRFVSGSEAPDLKPKDQLMQLLFGFSQWVGSDKLRKVTGWEDKRIIFSQNLGVYRRSYEAAVHSGDEDIARIQGRQDYFVTAVIEGFKNSK
ncbi:hypothetical protein V2G26_012391 [Clonostachys chloroleuca]